MPSTTLTLNFNESHAKRLLKLLICVEIGMVLLFLLDHYFVFLGRPHATFDLDDERSLSAWFSSTQLFMIGFLFLTQHFSVQYDTKIPLKLLTFVGLGFIFLSIDESVMIHEKLNTQLSSVLWLPKFKGGNGIWISVYALMLMFMLVLLKKDIINIWQLYIKEFLLFILGASLIGIGAVLLEIIGYEYLKYQTSQNGYKLEVAFEEGLEMLGASIILYATMLFTLRSNADSVSFNLAKQSKV